MLGLKLIHVSKRGYRVISIEVGLLSHLSVELQPYLPDEYCKFECFWSPQSGISERVDVPKYHFFLVGYYTANICASTSITVSLKRTGTPSVAAIIHCALIKTTVVNSFSQIQTGLNRDDIIQLIIVDYRDNLRYN